jgi:hypothetical protein
MYAYIAEDPIKWHQYFVSETSYHRNPALPKYIKGVFCFLRFRNVARSTEAGLVKLVTIRMLVKQMMMMAASTERNQTAMRLAEARELNASHLASFQFSSLSMVVKTLLSIFWLRLVTVEE